MQADRPDVFESNQTKPASDISCSVSSHASCGQRCQRLAPVQHAVHDCREKNRRIAAEQQLAAAVATAAADGARWREEVVLKQARIDSLMAGDRAKEADFMAQRVKELQVIVTFACHQRAQATSCAMDISPLLLRTR